jgi:hypothetical protein
VNAKVIVSLSASSNNFLNNDNHLNVAKVQELNGKIKEALKELPTVNEKGKAIKPPKPLTTYTIKRKAKIVKFDSALNNAGNLTYLARRAIPVKECKRLTERGAVRNLDILTVYDKEVIGDKLYKQCKEAMAAMKTHMGRADKTKESVKKEKLVIRDANNKEFARGVAAFKKFLKAAGVDLGKDLVESSGGMGGKAVLFRLDKETVVSIGRSDTSKFKAAKKAAEEAGDEGDDEDVKPAKNVKKVKKDGDKKKVKKNGLKKKSKK